VEAVQLRIVPALRSNLPDKDSMGVAQIVGRIHRRCKPRFGARSEGTRGDEGFTLIELLVVCLILPILIGAITVGFILILSQRSTVASRILDSTDAQTVSSNFETDVHSATEITTSSSAAQQCGSTGTPVLGLRWNLDSAGTYQTTVSYVTVEHAGEYSLQRNYCVGGSTTPSTQNEVAADIPSSQGAPAISPASANTGAAAGWVSTQGVTSVKLSITPLGSGYPYSLLGDPAVNASNNPSGDAVVPHNTTCDFASPGTGTYASTLCFVDFTGFQMAGNPTSYCPSTGQSEIDAAVADSPFTLKFCVKVTEDTPGSTVGPSVIPTYPYTNYGNGVTSEAFLGNNGFYGGIPGEPALYQTSEGGTDTVYFTKIEVLDGEDNTASGWSLVTGDAESTDDTEGMIWTTCTSVANPGTDSNGELTFNPNYSACAASSSAPAFTLLPNSSSSPFGNACFAPDYPNSSVGYANFHFSGVSYTNIFTGTASGSNTNTVQCFATVDSDKTGTVMVSAPTPSNLTVFMHGAGLEAVFVGLLLP
jgi:prepilin-type N-terminal cleavage/methylation domain-containing protein